MTNDITLPEAKFDHALDKFYEFLHKIAGGNLGPDQRLVVLNTITPYSIVKDKPLYDMFVLRAYADLVIRRTSATDAGSPKSPSKDIVESANSGDAWSSEYFLIAYPNLLQELKRYVKDPSVVAQIVALEDTWNGIFDAYVAELNSIEGQWDDYATKHGLSEDKDAAKYYRTKSDFFRKRKAKVQRLYDKQFALLIEINDLELSHLDSKGLQYKALKDNLGIGNQVKLPIRPELEDGIASDPTNSPGDYDQRPAIYPAGTSIFNDLLDDSHDGDEKDEFQRGYKISRTRDTSYSHDTDWGASGSGRKMFFLKANLSVSEKTHFEEQIKLIGGIDVGFKAIQDIVIIRGRWYSGSFLKGQIFQKWLDAQPEFRERLRHLITSVIVCRGLTVRLNFTKDIHQNSWRDLKMKGSGGISIAGYNLGLNGHYNTRTDWDLKDVTKNSVTFCDGPQVCRVLGLRVEDVLGGAKAIASHYDLNKAISKELMGSFVRGKMSYDEFLSATRK